jgi:hypothetical protein
MIPHISFIFKNIKQKIKIYLFFNMVYIGNKEKLKKNIKIKNRKLQKIKTLKLLMLTLRCDECLTHQRKQRE